MFSNDSGRVRSGLRGRAVGVGRTAGAAVCREFISDLLEVTLTMCSFRAVIGGFKSTLGLQGVHTEKLERLACG